MTGISGIPLQQSSMVCLDGCFRKLLVTIDIDEINNGSCGVCKSEINGM